MVELATRAGETMLAKGATAKYVQRMRRALVWLACALGAWGCPEPSSETGPPLASAPAPIVPTAVPSASARAAQPSWAAELPEVVAPLAAGQRVWAAPPQPGSEMVEVGIYTVEGVHDGRVSLTDRLTQRIDGVPGALVHAARVGAKMSQGDVVLCCGWTLSAVMGRVARVHGGRDIALDYDWGGATKTASIEHCQPPVLGLQPLAFVGFPKAGSTSRGLLLAADDERGWVRTASGHVEVHPLEALEALPLPRTERKKADRVRAYSWATGFQEGVVSEVVEPGLRYRVALDGGGPPRDYFFTMLLDPK